MASYKLDGTLLSSDGMIRFERGGIETNGALSNVNTATNKRTEMVFKCDGKKAKVVFKTAGTISSARVHFYTESGAFVSSSYLTIASSKTEFSFPSGAVFFKISVALASDAEVYAVCENEAVFNPYIINSAIGTSAAFVYNVSEGAYTSGRLMLPPNYTMDGKPVPLIVFVHGSGGMTTWDSILGYTSATADYRPYLEYLANEGFAVFDCFPWTDKETVTTPVYSPISVPVVLKSYLKGIEYVCSRFSVDINKVNLLCKSQGGEFGHWACTQTVFPFKTISLFAPATISGLSGSGSTGGLMYNSNTREAVTKYVDFEGTSEEIALFISNGSYSNSGVKAFCDSNKPRMLALMPFAHGITNAYMDDLYALNFETASTVPQWMLDEGIPSRQSGSVPLYALANHNEYVKLSSAPIRFWGAFDDTAVSMYNNYAICRWLQNSGADATFRTLPLNTGGHHAMDTDANALKSSGTTALGISYSNMPTAYVEVVDFIRLKCGD